MTDELKPETGNAAADAGKTNAAAIVSPAPAKKDVLIEAGSNSSKDAAAAEAAAEQGQTVTVRALRTFHKDPSLHGEMVQPGDTFDCPRQRAAELRANGLIEYPDANDDKAIHGEVDSARIEERVQRDTDARKIADRNKTTPLRNPELKLAEVTSADLAKADSGKSK